MYNGDIYFDSEVTERNATRASRITVATELALGIAGAYGFYRTGSYTVAGGFILAIAGGSAHGVAKMRNSYRQETYSHTAPATNDVNNQVNL